MKSKEEHILTNKDAKETFNPWDEITWYRPADIEFRSMEIIRSEIGERQWEVENEPVILRAIHTSADFDYAKQLYFSPDVVSQTVAAIREGAHIVTDTRMAWSGISRKTVTEMGGDVHCFMSDSDVAEEAKRRDSTRATVCMDRGVSLQEKLGKPVIFAIGNAPTALIRLAEIMANTDFRPQAIVAAPVGFVNVVEAKELIIQSGCPAIVARGRKGGSNIAAAICNALIYLASGRISYETTKS